jgi:hypothetical protein
VPVLAGFKFPYKVISTSDALGVWRKFIESVDVTADAGEANNPRNSAVESRKVLNFIVQ